MRPDACQERATGRKSAMVVLYSQLPGEKQQQHRAAQGKHRGQSLGRRRKENRGQLPRRGFCGKAG